MPSVLLLEGLEGPVSRTEPRKKKRSPPHAISTLSVYNPGEAKGEGRRDKSWGQNDSEGLNTGVHLDLIGSNALFQTPSAYLKRSLGNRLLSYCESIILQIYSCLRSHYNRCQQRNPSCQGAASHEKKVAEATGQANKTSRPHCKRKQQCLSQYFPTSPNNSKGWCFEKKRRKKVTVAIKKQDQAVGFVLGGELSVCCLGPDSTFSATEINVCPHGGGS